MLYMQDIYLFIYFNIIKFFQLYCVKLGKIDILIVFCLFIFVDSMKCNNAVDI